MDIDLIYRNRKEFEREIAAVVEQFRASCGYTTCMWHNLATCRIVYDRDGELEAMKKRFDVPCPEELRDEIIRKNRALLSGVLPVLRCTDTEGLGQREILSALITGQRNFWPAILILFCHERTDPSGEKRPRDAVRRAVKICRDRFEGKI